MSSRELNRRIGPRSNIRSAKPCYLVNDGDTRTSHAVDLQNWLDCEGHPPISNLAYFLDLMLQRYAITYWRNFRQASVEIVG